jgi:hypothetical protein
MGVSLLQIPEVVQVAIGEDDKAAILGPGIFTSLLLADERAFILRLGLQYDQGKALFIEQEKSIKPFPAISKFSPTASIAALVSFTLGSRTILALPLSSSKKRHPDSSSSLFILIRALASLACIGYCALCNE